jgi:DNA-binding NarL/FixJ family response regulator
MIRVFIADTRSEERFALRAMMRGLDFEVVGEAADWPTTVEQAPASGTEMLVVDWDLLPSDPSAALGDLRKRCQAKMAVVLISRLDARQQAALSSGADMFISKGEGADRLAERCLQVAASIRPETTPG